MQMTTKDNKVLEENNLKNKIIRIIVILAILVVILDQASKVLVNNIFQETWGNDYFKIEIATNTGMAFGFNDGNVKKIFLTCAVLGIIISFIRKQVEQLDTKTAVVLGMILGGGFGNLIDRLFCGGVFDFIKILKFPNFNVADMFIVTGWILLVAFLAIFTKKCND